VRPYVPDVNPSGGEAVEEFEKEIRKIFLEEAKQLLEDVEEWSGTG
jgi:hypothetical protein